jgi:TatD DNase family protein
VVLIDTHCHLSKEPLLSDVVAALERGREAGVERVVMAGYDPADWKEQFVLAMSHPQVYPVFGIHPWVAAAMTTEDELMNAMMELVATMDRVVPLAIGETGLDRSQRCPKETHPAQLACFRGQLAIAKQVGLPLVLHVVQAHGLALETMKEVGLSKAGGVVHGFTGSAEVAAEYQKLGLYLSFSPTIIRHPSDKFERTVRAVSADRLLVESDGPDQSPAGASYGEPAHVVAVVEELARIRGVSKDEMGTTCTANAETLFRFNEATEEPT